MTTIDKEAIRTEQRQKIFEYLAKAMQEGSFSCFVTLVDGHNFPDIRYDLELCQLQLIRDVLLSDKVAAEHPYVRDWLDNCLTKMTRKEAAKREIAAATQTLEELSKHVNQ